MPTDRSRYGLLVACIGAVLLAVSVFLPWYGVSLTAGGAAYVSQLGEQVASQYGNAALQGLAGQLHTALASAAGHQLATVSAHQVLKNISVVLLVLAGLALLDALIPLARGGQPGGSAGGSLALLGLVASACVAYRMAVPPTPAGGLVALSLRGGAWLSLLGALGILAGGLWPRVPQASAESSSAAHVEGAWANLSGWTPQG
jgi:hypothetical protein